MVNALERELIEELRKEKPATNKRNGNRTYKCTVGSTTENWIENLSWTVWFFRVRCVNKEENRLFVKRKKEFAVR